MLSRNFPFTFCDRVLIDFRIAAFIDGVVRYPDQRRDIPDAFVASRFVPLERMTLYVPYERVQQDETGA